MVTNDCRDWRGDCCYGDYGCCGDGGLVIEVLDRGDCGWCLRKNIAVSSVTVTGVRDYGRGS